jgi:cell division protein FtsL
MLRFVNICLVLGLVALAYVIYEVKYEARGLDEGIAGLKKDIESERDAVAVLRAEWSLLNRPERIQRLAEKYLKLAPAQPHQLVTLDTVSESDFVQARTEAADQAMARAPAPAAAPESVPLKIARGDADPADPVSAKADPAKAAPAKVVPVKTVTAKPIPAKAIPAKIVPVKAVAAEAASVTALPPVTVSAPGE